MYADRPPRRLVAVLAGLSCLLLPLLSHLPKASATTADGDPGSPAAPFGSRLYPCATSQQPECPADTGPLADFVVATGIRSGAGGAPDRIVAGIH
ncbi:hypothetical protein [Streptomyces sp. NBC_01217]|uniref:hypothetical protein n=1 Tax=Streptomyces sp. NBC_01217 TaxID=2903779 RepID=UPI002E121359|nr:hypothetical protein OG507_36035 [Streptomyces sp. NBC_01217]